MSMSRFALAALALTLALPAVADEKAHDHAAENAAAVAPVPAVGGVNYGAAVTADGAVPATKALADGSLTAGPVKLSGKTVGVCQTRGCWMTLDTGGEPLRIEVKEHGYFLPSDLVGCEVVVEGNLEVKEMSVAEQRHFLEDAGKSAAEIAAVAAPKTQLTMVADGILVVSR